MSGKIWLPGTEFNPTLISPHSNAIPSALSAAPTLAITNVRPRSVGSLEALFGVSSTAIPRSALLPRILWRGYHILSIGTGSKIISPVADGCRGRMVLHSGVRISFHCALNDLATAFNSTILATAALSETTRFFDLVTFDLIREPLEHPDAVLGLAFS
ncbi:hypothetical protein BDR06DRAFT_1015182 [Suillus hirtellus]|nr:hypothetical protein BDR06DRAFT_1015182 [Suillus hirtellus]